MTCGYKNAARQIIEGGSIIFLDQPDAGYIRLG